jgi:hypothetical protein
MLLEDVHSVICLDISESMADSDGWTDARTFITDYLTGDSNNVTEVATLAKHRKYGMPTVSLHILVDEGLT